MPNGYRGSALPSVWRGAGTGLGALLASFLTKPMREREEQEEQIRDAYEQAKLTGDKKQLGKLREQYPKAVARFERERGLELPPMPSPEVAGGTMELPRAAGPPLEPGMTALPSARPMPGAPVEPSRMPGAAVTMPGTETAEMPWPTTGAGMQVRGAHEMMAGKPMQPFMKPEPGDITAQAVRTVMALPADQQQRAWDSLREKYADLPDIKFKGFEELGPVTVRETAAIEALWQLTPAERALWHEQHMLPKRTPDELDPEMPRPLSVADFANIFQVTPEQIMTYQFTKKVPASLKLRTEGVEPKSWLMKWASQIAERTRGARKQMGEEPEAVWDVAKAIMNGTYNFEMYQSSLALDEEVQSLKMMLLQARQMKPRNKLAEKQLSMQMAEKLGIEWKSGTAFMDFLMSLVTPQYGQTVTQPAPGQAPPTSIEEAAKRGIR